MDAPPATVWPLVASVDSIRPEEQRPALYLALGFPNKDKANLGKGVVAPASLRTRRKRASRSAD